LSGTTGERPTAGGFRAWAVTGQISKLQVWSDLSSRPDAGEPDDQRSSVRIATSLVEQQKFLLRSRDGREVQVHLHDSGVAFQNGHIATAAWVAREGASHGHCVFVKNHTSGASAKLEDNMKRVRTEVPARKIAGFGLLATVPAAFALFAWLLVPGSLAAVDFTMFLLGASIALVVLFTVGAVVAKLVFDYARSEDDDKIWAAVERAMEADSNQLQRPVSRVPTRA
jgi:hypothetical protein